MTIWFKHFIYTNEIFSNNWRLDDDYRLSGIPEIQSNKKVKSISDVDVWKILYYEPGNVGVYRAHDPDCELLIIVHELFIEDRETIEVYHVSSQFKEIIDRLDSLGITVIDRI